MNTSIEAQIRLRDRTGVLAWRLGVIAGSRGRAQLPLLYALECDSEVVVGGVRPMSKASGRLPEILVGRILPDATVRLGHHVLGPLGRCIITCDEYVLRPNNDLELHKPDLGIQVPVTSTSKTLLGRYAAELLAMSPTEDIARPQPVLGEGGLGGAASGHAFDSTLQREIERFVELAHTDIPLPSQLPRLRSSVPAVQGI